MKKILFIVSGPRGQEGEDGPKTLTHVHRVGLSAVGFSLKKSGLYHITCFFSVKRIKEYKQRFKR